MSNKTFYMTDLEKIEVGEAPMPKIGADDVMIQVRSVGIFGSALLSFRIHRRFQGGISVHFGT